MLDNTRNTLAELIACPTDSERKRGKGEETEQRKRRGREQKRTVSREGERNYVRDNSAQQMRRVCGTSIPVTNATITQTESPPGEVKRGVNNPSPSLSECWRNLPLGSSLHDREDQRDSLSPPPPLEGWSVEITPARDMQGAEPGQTVERTEGRGGGAWETPRG